MAFDGFMNIDRGGLGISTCFDRTKSERKHGQAHSTTI